MGDAVIFLALNDPMLEGKGLSLVLWQARVYNASNVRTSATQLMMMGGLHSSFPSILRLLTRGT